MIDIFKKGNRETNKYLIDILVMFMMILSLIYFWKIYLFIAIIGYVYIRFSNHINKFFSLITKDR